MTLQPFSLKPLDAKADFCNREDELTRLKAMAQDGTNVVLQSPRRYGKTSLVRRVQHELEQEGFLTIYVDFFGVDSVLDVTTRLAQAIYSGLHRKESLLDKGRKLLGGFMTLRPVLKPSDKGVSIGVEHVAPERDPLEMLPAVLDELGELIAHKEYPVNLVFDEFQEVCRLKESAQVEGLMRSRIQHHQSAYFFVGSRRGMLLAMFSDRKRPFFQSAVVIELPPLPEDDALAYIVAGFESAGKNCPPETAQVIAKKTEGYAYYIQRVARELFDLAPETASEDLLDTALENVLAGERFGFEATLGHLPAPQIKLLKALAQGSVQEAFGTGFLARTGLPQATVKYSLDKLREEDLIEKGENGQWRVIDPFFRMWLQKMNAEIG